ncbi:MAG: 1-acyl-sn-glycerol-3-phosphate acyltransferase [Actinomycetia bacterium]|nr:1-acyl-sn-glycerol-3-phosphate acyltransferase [Actinomycetes bacterium]
MGRDEVIRKASPVEARRSSNDGLPLRRVNREPGPWAFPFMAHGAHALLRLVARREWRGQDRLPLDGPAIIVPNHVSSLDPLFVGEFVAYAGRWPYFLAKASLFRVPGVRFLFRRAGMVPVFREMERGGGALDQAARLLGEGRVVVIYPEGTTTYDPQVWPMTARTGAARLALLTGAPVVPLGHWGIDVMCPDNGSPQRLPHLVPRHDVVLELGTPLDLARFGRDPTDAVAVRAAGEAMMDAITALVERVRGEPCPPGRWDAKARRRIVPGG